MASRVSCARPAVSACNLGTFSFFSLRHLIWALKRNALSEVLEFMRSGTLYGLREHVSRNWSKDVKETYNLGW